MKKIAININGMHCASCSLRIDGDLEELEGVNTSETDFIKGITKVVFDQTKVNIENLLQTITNAGYKVEGFKEYD